MIIYPNEARAKEVAGQLNLRRGFAKAKALPTPQGWTVITDYAFGRSGPTPETKKKTLDKTRKS